MKEDRADLRFRLALAVIGLGAIAVFLVVTALRGQNGLLAIEAVGFGGALMVFLLIDTLRKLRRLGASRD